MDERKLVIWGCGGMGREVLDLCEQLGREVIGFLDDRPDMRGQTVDGVPVLGGLADIVKLRGDVKVICAGVGSPVLKKRFVHQTKEHGFTLAETLVHPSVRLSPKNRLGLGSVICEGAILTIHVRVGDFVIVNTRATLAHDVTVADYATISPGVNISGNVSIGEGAFIGTGSALREKITVGAWSVIGGGAFVKDDVPAGVLCAGVPAVVKKKLL
ncbi:acetyltransferase [Paenibacillus piri]|uniref:Acetyltransferase n=1 Tax=Paenibacillus piri TaxID=2547395 RepID=A0A4R5KBQ8_9BACL|nr:acetyltransferase [Paenibacillus piri]TDF92342.1 acetyltransferase [Paenibacillus piri]